MKLFTKVALVSAIAISGQAMAMQAMDDSSLSAATGQDGIDLTIKADEVQIASLILHDNDGLATTATLSPSSAITANGTGTAGGITVNNISIKADQSFTPAPVVALLASKGVDATTLSKVTIDADAGASGTNPFLNVNMLNNAMHITVGSIGVGASKAAPDFATATSLRRGVTNEATILSNIDLKVGASALNIQLGNQPQGALIVANGTVFGGITLGNLDIQDNANGGTIGIQGLRIASANSRNLAVDTKIGVKTTGLEIKSNGAQDLYIGGITLGQSGLAAGAKSIGSLEINGLNMVNSSILVAAH